VREGYGGVWPLGLQRLNSGEHFRQSRLTNASETRNALFLLAELVAVVQANDPDLFKRWLYCAIHGLGEPTFFPTQPIPMPNILYGCAEDDAPLITSHPLPATCQSFISLNIAKQDDQAKYRQTITFRASSLIQY